MCYQLHHNPELFACSYGYNRTNNHHTIPAQSNHRRPSASICGYFTFQCTLPSSSFVCFVPFVAIYVDVVGGGKRTTTEGLEPSTSCFVGRRSSRLSYAVKQPSHGILPMFIDAQAGTAGLEPATSRLTAGRTTIVLRANAVEGEGVEPPRPQSTTVFETVPVANRCDPPKLYKRKCVAAPWSGAATRSQGKNVAGRNRTRTSWSSARRSTTELQPQIRREGDSNPRFPKPGSPR